MQIYGPSQLHGAQPISAPHNLNRTPASDSATRAASSGDELHLSEAGQIAARLSDIPEIRQDRVAALKAAIASGTYETSERLSGAVSRLLDEIG
jgi:negative regulator of flagellin synthesis FlgM